MLSKIFAPALLAYSVAAQRTQSRWGQCGGSGYSGPTRCPDTFYCTVGNPWYSQCVEVPANPADSPVPGVPDSPIQTSSFVTVITVTQSQNVPTVVTTYITFLTPRVTSSATFSANPPPPTMTLVPDQPISFEPVPPKVRRREPVVQEPNEKRLPMPAKSVDVDAPTPTTLKQGQYWIRAVASPHFHEYLQTNPQNEAATAVLGKSTSAGQYNIVSGQLVSAFGDVPLYMNVEKPADFTQRKLATWFNTTKNEFGTFAFSGDALTWSTPEVKRQNLAAWLVCEQNHLYINTGAYAYQTPSGCADQTIHYYNGATANN